MDLQLKRALVDHKSGKCDANHTLDKIYKIFNKKRPSIKVNVLSCAGNLTARGAAEMCGCSLNTVYTYWKSIGYKPKREKYETVSIE